MVVRPRGQGRRLPDLSDVGRLAAQSGAVRRGRRSHLPHRLCAQGQDAAVQRRGGGAVRDQFRTCEEERDRGRSLGDDLAAQQRSRRRRLSHRELEARRRDDLCALRQLEERAAAESAAHHRARHSLRRHAPRADGEGRCRLFHRLCAEGFRPAPEGRQGAGGRRADPELPVVRRAEHRRSRRSTT